MKHFAHTCSSLHQPAFQQLPWFSFHARVHPRFNERLSTTHASLETENSVGTLVAAGNAETLLRATDLPRPDETMYASTLCPAQDQETPEQRLWKAVIAKTLEEWISGPTRRQEAAEIYLLHDKKDFRIVCQSAGVDPERLRRRLIELKRSGAAGAARRSEAA